MATTTRGPRSFVSEFTVSVGPVNVLGKLIPVRVTGANDSNKFVSVCPDCPDTPVKPRQTYICPDGHDHPIGELAKAKELDDGVLAFVDVEAVKEARTSTLPLNVMRATVHPAEEVENATFPSDMAYVLVPRNRDEYHDLLVDLVANSDKAFVAQINLRNTEGFYRLTEWRGSLVVQRLYWPSDVNDFTEYKVGVDSAVYNAAYSMIERVEQEFNPATYVATSRERLEALTAALDPTAASPAVPAGTPRPKVDVQADLLSILTSFGEVVAPAKKKKKSA